MIFLYLNDEETLRKEGTQTDPYQVFRRLVARGDLGPDFESNLRVWQQVHEPRRHSLPSLVGLGKFTCVPGRSWTGGARPGGVWGVPKTIKNFLIPTQIRNGSSEVGRLWWTRPRSSPTWSGSGRRWRGWGKPPERGTAHAACGPADATSAGERVRGGGNTWTRMSWARGRRRSATATRRARGAVASFRVRKPSLRNRKTWRLRTRNSSSSATSVVRSWPRARTWSRWSKFLLPGGRIGVHGRSAGRGSLVGHFPVGRRGAVRP
ncbi:MAG: hypothetical protein HYY04_17095 [Chloroflexi bacterium]|nr:hypothetical protein [Chloroflexota bacterium]